MTITADQLNQMARAIHAENVARGWWDEYPQKHQRIELALMLTVSEIAEAMEGYRKDLMDDHLPHFPMLHVELADALIRLLDLSGAIPDPFRIREFEKENRDYEFSYFREICERDGIPQALYRICQHLCALDGADVSCAVWSIIELSRFLDAPIMEIVRQKRVYNNIRPDHSREERAKAGGKKF